MKKFALIAGMTGLLLFSGTALADENKKDEHAGHGTTQVQPAVKQETVKTTAPTQTPASTDAQTHNMTTEEHKNMTSDEHSSTDATHEDANGTHEEEATESGGHGGHENVVETPPNIPVLSTFGAINAAFILFGVWNKWFRKKEVLA
jgi:hypothetical protein